MTIIIALFYLSLLTIIAMVSWKFVTLRELKLSLVDGVENELHSKLYEFMHHAWYVFRTVYVARVYAWMLSVFYVVAHEVLHFAEVVGVKLKERHRKWFDMVKGKGVIRKKGSASFFLRDVSEYKKTIQVK